FLIIAGCLISYRRVPTPVAIIISAAVFTLAHFTPEAFPKLFVLGTFMGISYAQTRNLLAPITIHAFWNTGVALLLSSLEAYLYRIRLNVVSEVLNYQ
ncbi:hypothetical protein HN873_051564, partial [Arachis hypogaea]